MPRFLVVVLSCVAFMSFAAPGALAGPAQQAPNTGPLVPELDWKPCEPGWECATARVPRDYARPDGPKIELALTRRPATDRKNRIGSLFFNPGGPGGSGVDFVQSAPPGALAAFGRLYDIVGFDPRGVGRSRPLIRGCHPRILSNAFIRPETADRDALVAQADAQLRRCRQRSGGILPYLTTGNTARDLNLLRAAVGDRKLNFVALSYGTLIAETYTTLFPGRTGAIVADAPVDGDLQLNEPFEASIEQKVSFENSLRRFLHWCSRHQEICALDPDDPEDDYDDLVERLNQAPVPVLDDPGQTPVNGDELLVASEASMSLRSWTDLAGILGQAKNGDGSAARAFLGPPSDGSESDGAFFAYHANERRYPRRPGRLMQAAEHGYAVSDHFFYLRGYEWMGLARWPYQPRGAFYGPFRHSPSARPVMVIGGTHDPNTPYKFAKRYVADLGNARLVRYRSDGHVAITSLDGCIVRHYLAYLNDGTLPEPGATCRQQPPTAATALRQGVSEAELRRWRKTTLVD